MKEQLTKFCPRATSMEYLQDYANTCCFSSLVSALFSSGEYVAEHDIAEPIK